MQFIAHRGIHDKYKENSIEAFKECLRQNIDIELDIQLSKDKEIIVFHDKTLLRLYKTTKQINNLNANYLKKYYNIPTLKEVLTLINGQVKILIEIKTSKFNNEIESKLNDTLKNYKGFVYILSFNPISLIWFKNNNNKYPRIFLIINITLLNKIFIKLIKPYAIGQPINTLTKKTSKYKIYAYTLKTKKEYEKYKHIPDAFITDINKEIAPLRTISQKE